MSETSVGRRVLPSQDETSAIAPASGKALTPDQLNSIIDFNVSINHV